MEREGAFGPATREYRAGKGGGGGGMLGFGCLALNSVSSRTRVDFSGNIVL